MIGVNEVAQKAVEKPQSSFDPSKRVGEVNGETKKLLTIQVKEWNLIPKQISKVRSQD
ncbi:MAG: hypothetical protein SPF98_07235 [Campylobacter sp.]|nr:hypothetical protein [Campylobacter sp.]